MIEGRALAIAGRLQPTDLLLERGQLVALIGPNGGGKTSLLRALADHDDATGAVLVDGRDPATAGPWRSQMVAMMAASRDLGWAIPVRDVVQLGNEQIDPAAIDAMIDRFELGPLAARPANQLSTGERARVLMARALAGCAPLLLLDEPLSNLDPYWVLRFVDVMRARAAAGSAVLCALHDLSLIDRFDRVLLIADGKVQMDERPAAMIAGEPFRRHFRILPDQLGGWCISLPADPRSSP